MIAIVGIFGPIAEELVFRGMVFRTLRKGFPFADVYKRQKSDCDSKCCTDTKSGRNSKCDTDGDSVANQHPNADAGSHKSAGAYS